jgi:HEAT repeat protein
MSNGDDADEGAIVESLEARLDDAAEALEAAETEADLDEVEATLEDIESDLEAAEMPEPEDEDEEDRGEALAEQLSGLRDDLADARGPYLEDVTAAVEAAEETVAGGEWTETGEDEAVDAVATFLESAGEAVDADLGAAGEGPADAEAALADARADLEALTLDPDEDSETLEALVAATDALADDLEAAEEWDDLTVREQLDAQGFYDVLDPENRKDFPPEWNAVKIYAQGKEPEPILTALERFESDFMEENVLDALERFAPEDAFDALHERAQKRAKQPIRILGRIGDERATDTLEDFLGGGDVSLEKVTLRALGAIGSEESTQAVADRLAADDPEIRSVAARSLGLIGDTRAIDPLADVLADDDADEVRASAAWALNQIGTQDALDAAAEYADDRSFIVQAEAEKAAGA